MSSTLEDVVFVDNKQVVGSEQETVLISSSASLLLKEYRQIETARFKLA